MQMGKLWDRGSEGKTCVFPSRRGRERCLLLTLRQTNYVSSLTTD
jgi:hypothetical protein